MSRLPATLLASIDADKAALDAARPLSREVCLSLRAKLMPARAGGVNASTSGDDAPAPSETQVVLESLLTAEMSARAPADAARLGDAIRYAEDIVAQREPLCERQIRNLHRLVLKGQGEVRPYRQENVAIAGAATHPPDFLDVPAAMSALIDWYGAAAALHPIARAAQLHTRFVGIHPFVDGNGRTARLLLGLELMKAGYPPAAIRTKDRRAYYDALDGACMRGDFGDITRVVAQAVQRALRLTLDLLGPRRADPFPNLPDGEPTCPLPLPPR
ncbi:Fic family protein [Burkholderia stagnalis]|uniref:Fic family protein n=1 Tax=Burkholderia stagnalis TaxID=1503054 RepID=UPI00075F51E6|nr:Fic family protein [Burkholderia stagnalis]KVC61261.1 cell filamentation protein Fic [Burkholderia stagnalis]KVN20184.1 cell filamentation protein Fic [Burkholderia stagnalis]KWI71500.1 cell filamentation protein Fic [Burkholderia stagnalis]KWK72539.1 cell filamentation protein Fic [Burkholderia stagnalis]KWN10396.1 cell filamentation protein Fic [Burkholderia stagnalis]